MEPLVAVHAPVWFAQQCGTGWWTGGSAGTS